MYQIYPRSFAGSNGDGHGDLAGIRARLDVAFNFSFVHSDLEAARMRAVVEHIGGLPDGTVAISTSRAREGERTGGALALGPWEGLVIAVGG